MVRFILSSDCRETQTHLLEAKTSSARGHANTVHDNIQYLQNDELNLYQPINSIQWYELEHPPSFIIKPTRMI